MKRKKLSIRVGSLVVFIFIVNYLAMNFYWYWSIWWFDMPMHFLGGFWLGLFLIWLFPLEKMSGKMIFKIILGVLLIGIFWEIFEVIVNNNTLQLPFNTLDTLSDIFFDLAGGTFAVFYFLKRIMFLDKSFSLPPLLNK